MDNIYYDYFLEFPYSNIKTNFKEITTKDQLYLSKSRLTFNENENYFNFIKDVYLTSIKDKNKFQNIDLIEFLFYIIKSRTICTGSKLELMTEIDGITAKLNLNLNDVLKNIYDSVDTNLLKISYKNYDIVLGFPYLKDFPIINSSKKNTIDVINSFYLFVKKINNIEFSNLTTEQREILFNKLPLSLVFKIKQNILNLFEDLDKKNIFNLDYFKNFKLNVYSNSYIEIIKILSLYDIESIHREIYLLSDMNPDYLMKISPSERRMYLNFYMQEKESKSKNPFPME
jgi:hypothetical protein